ncbi:MAG: type IV pilus assembly protein PilE [Candidatus Azotimanducaceae bacterium]|jgi:type IV pilus assembly protein PilE
MKGYSLIELMVVVAIIGIIGTIAYPRYQSYTCDTYVSQAVADLRICSLAMDRYYSNDFTYVGALVDGSGGSLCGTQSPSQGVAMFDITLGSQSKTDFTLTAAPAAGQSCGGTMTLTADGTFTQP